MWVGEYLNLIKYNFENLYQWPDPGYSFCSILFVAKRDMGTVKELISDQIMAITSLCKGVKANKEIANMTRLSLWSAQRWALDKSFEMQGS